jgi:hypothetical protein
MSTFVTVLFNEAINYQNDTVLVTDDLHDEKNQTTETKICHSDKQFTTNPTQTGLGLSLGLC